MASTYNQERDITEVFKSRVADWIAAGDDIIDPDSAVSAMGQLAADLNEASSGEIEFLKAAIREQIGLMPHDRSPADQAKVNFLLDFLETLGNSPD